MEGQLVAGQWVEVSMEDLRPPVQLSGFVLSLRQSEMLLTFPELLAPPMGLESECLAILRYSNRYGFHTATGHVVRVASGPPVTVTFERLAQVETDQRRAFYRAAIRLPVSVEVVTTSVPSSLGQQQERACTQNVSVSGLLLETSLLLAVGDSLRLSVTSLAGSGSKVVTQLQVQGRVIRVEEREPLGKRPFEVGVELLFGADAERDVWAEFALRFGRRQRKQAG